MNVTHNDAPRPAARDAALLDTLDRPAVHIENARGLLDEARACMLQTVTAHVRIEGMRVAGCDQTRAPEARDREAFDEAAAMVLGAIELAKQELDACMIGQSSASGEPCLAPPRRRVLANKLSELDGLVDEVRENLDTCVSLFAYVDGELELGEMTGSDGTSREEFNCAAARIHAALRTMKRELSTASEIGNTGDKAEEGSASDDERASGDDDGAVDTATAAEE